MSWRAFTNWAKRKQIMLHVAARLGKGRGRIRWLDQINPPRRAPLLPNVKNLQMHELAACWLGHATVLLRIGGMTILTDPVLSHRVGLGMGLVTAGPRRHVAAALTARQLPPLDLILISHAHFDHLDRQTLSQLDKRVPVVTAHHTRDLIRDLGFRRVTELKWNEKTAINGVTITAREVSHWGARTFLDQHRGYNAYLLESGSRRVLYGGDTAYHERFKDIGKVDLAIIGIGAYDPYIQAHANPEQAWAMANHVDADYVLPIHHSTFRLSHEPMNEPLERILKAANGSSHKIIGRQIGSIWSLDAKAPTENPPGKQ